MTILTKSDYEFIVSHIEKREYFSYQNQHEYPKVWIEPGRFSVTTEKFKDGDYYVGVNIQHDKNGGSSSPVAEYEFDEIFGSYAGFCKYMKSRKVECEIEGHVRFGEQISMF